MHKIKLIPSKYDKNGNKILTPSLESKLAVRQMIEEASGMSIEEERAIRVAQIVALEAKMGIKRDETGKIIGSKP